MDNALTMDVILAAVLLAGALIGWIRGLFKTLMGVVVVLAALIGSVMLANLLTDPITDIIAPRVEDAVVKQFSDVLDRETKDKTPSGASLRAGLDEVEELMERYGLPAGTLDGLVNSLTETVGGITEQARDKAADAFRNAIGSGVRSVVSGAVHTVLVLVLYIALLIGLKLATNLLDHVFDLPVLEQVNNLGGAALGLLEAALLLYVVVYVGAHFGVKAITGHANDGYLLPLFLNHSPVELISSLSQ